MTVLREGALELTLPHGVQGRKFDDSSHGLSHCMKAVDFIVEEPDRVLFIEFKDPDHPRANAEDRKVFLKELLSGGKDDDLVRKYRDSFIYRWAEKAGEKPIFYYVLIASSQLDEAMLLARTDELKRKLPAEGPASGAWQRQIVADCVVFNLKTWNERLPKYTVTRAAP
ncbi:MAG: hypothetical protein D6816_19070 [Bacteroidetes bacterium]|nr:MAG: hypothetical protein D6816_19070 [Bacteroidota bacterium]